MEPTYNPKLDKIFNTLDANDLKNGILGAYLVKTYLTTLVDRVDPDKAITFNAENKEWLVGETRVNTFERSTYKPFPIARIFHELYMDEEDSCCGSEEYRTRMYETVNRIVEAYLIVMIPYARTQKISSLTTELATLKIEKTRLQAERNSITVVEDSHAIAIENELSEKQALNTKYQTLITGLQDYRGLFVQSPSRMAELFSTARLARDAKRLELLPLAQATGYCTNELRTEAEASTFLIIVRQLKENVQEEVNVLMEQAAEVRLQNDLAHAQVQEQANQDLLAVVDRIAAIKLELKGLNATTV